MSWQEIDAAQAHEVWKNEKDVVVLDVRQEWEYTGP
jgi:rhodanese-related sulfurtransferase